MADISMKILGQNYRIALFLESLACSLIKNGFSRQPFFLITIRTIVSVKLQYMNSSWLLIKIGRNKFSSFISTHSFLDKEYFIDCFLDKKHTIEIWLLQNRSRIPQVTYRELIFVRIIFYGIYFYKCGVQTIFRNLLLQMNDC